MSCKLSLPPHTHPVFVSVILVCRSRSRFPVSVGSCLKERREETCKHKKNLKQRKITSAAETPGQRQLPEQFFNETLFQLMEPVQLQTVPKPGEPHTTTTRTRTPSQIYPRKKKQKTNHSRAQAMPHPEPAAPRAAPRSEWRQREARAPCARAASIPSLRATIKGPRHKAQITRPHRHQLSPLSPP